MSLFSRATKKQSKARIALTGPAGSGKTFTALQIAKVLAQGGKIALIDTERGSASKYSGDVADFDVCELSDFNPANFIAAISDAEEQGYAVLIIDSLSHEWEGEGGILSMVDKAQQSAKNQFTVWGKLTPKHNAMIGAMLGARMHVIATLRVKTEYVLEQNDKGKTEPRKIGLKPIQRDGVDHEFDIIGAMDLDHVLAISKTRCPVLDRGVFAEPGEEIAQTVLAWLNDGEERTVDRLANELRVMPADAQALEKWARANAAHREDLRKLTNQLKAKAERCGVRFKEDLGKWIKDGAKQPSSEDSKPSDAKAEQGEAPKFFDPQKLQLVQIGPGSGAPVADIKNVDWLEDYAKQVEKIPELGEHLKLVEDQIEMIIAEG